MTDKQQTEAGLKSLYQITGEIADINTILVNRGEFHRLQVDLERERMRLFACGVVAMADTPDSAREARAMHPDYESASCDDVKRRVDECIELRARVAELEDVLTNLPLSSPQRLRARIQRLEEMLAAVGAGGVGPLIPATVQHQRNHNNDNDLQRKTGHLISSSSSVPAGWKLVPVEPTREMLDAARKDLVRDAEIDPMLKGIHSAMLDAAPQPPVAEHPQQPFTNADATQKFSRVAERKLDSLLADGWAISGYSICKLLPSSEMRHGFVTSGGLVGWWQEPHPTQAKHPPTTEQSSAVEQQQGEQEPVALLADAIRSEPTELIHKWRVLELIQDHARQQPKRELMDNEARRIYNAATYHASLAVFMTRMDAENPDADDKGVSGWLQEAEDRVKRRITEAAHEIGQAAAPQQGEQEPVFWYRPVGEDGRYEGPIHNSAIERVRRLSGAWVPLVPSQQPPDHAYLLRDLADDISVDAMDLIAAIRDAGLGDYSINMRLPAKVCVAMCKRFADVEHRPVARVAGTGHLGGHFDWCVPGNQGVPRGTLLYTRPQPQREPLTDEQVPKGVLSAISRAGLALLKTQHGYELQKLSQAVAHSIGGGA